MFAPLLAFLILAFSAWMAPAIASPEASEEQPLEITADSTLEWNRDAHQYVARKNAKAVQGNFSVSADTLTADYAEEGNGTAITHLTAEGNVLITSGTSQVTGDKAVYDVAGGLAVITGDNLKLQGDGLNVTAKEKFEYHANEGKLVAFGRPLVTYNQDTLEANQVTAWIDTQGTQKKSANQPAGGDLKRAEATGNVVIKTATETATGDRATYDAKTSQAELIGHATIQRDQNTLHGERAQIDLTTGLSRMLGGDGKDTRVKGVFYPASKKN
jgi:lipopolysaccharide export system protein LptA